MLALSEAQGVSLLVFFFISLFILTFSSYTFTTFLFYFLIPYSSSVYLILIFPFLILLLSLFHLLHFCHSRQYAVYR
jgi:hypothetical protein